MLCIKGGVQDYSFLHSPTLKINSAIMIRWNHFLFSWENGEKNVDFFLRKKTPKLVWKLLHYEFSVRVTNRRILLSSGAKCPGSGARRSMQWQAGNHYCALSAKEAPPVFPYPRWKLLQTTSLPFPVPALALHLQGQPSLVLDCTQD